MTPKKPPGADIEPGQVFVGPTWKEMSNYEKGACAYRSATRLVVPGSYGIPFYRDVMDVPGSPGRLEFDRGWADEKLKCEPTGQPMFGPNGIATAAAQAELNAQEDAKLFALIEVPPLSFAEAVDQLHTMFPVMQAWSEVSKMTEPVPSWVQDSLMGEFTPEEGCVCGHGLSAHRWINRPSPISRSRMLACKLCDCTGFKDIKESE